MKVIKKAARLLLFAQLFLTIELFAHEIKQITEQITEQATEKQAETETVNITTEHWPPFNYQAANGEIIGQATAKVRAIFALAGVNHNINLYPWARAYHLASTKANTAIYTIIRTPAREAQFQWVCPLQKPAQHYFFRQTSRSEITMQTVEDAKQYSLGVAREGFDQQFLQDNGFVAEVDFETAATDEVNLKKVLKGRLDLIIGTEYAINLYLTQSGRSTDEMTKVLNIGSSAHLPNCLALNHNTAKTTVDKLRKALIQINTKQANKTQFLINEM